MPPGMNYDRLGPIAQVLVYGVVAARVLYPAEDAATGTGMPAIVLGLFAGLLTFWHALRNSQAPPIRLPMILLAGTVAFIGLCWLGVTHAVYQLPTIYYAWEWTVTAVLGGCVWYWSTHTGPRPVLALLLALGIGQALRGGYQVIVETPTLLAAFDRNDDDVIRAMAVQGLSQDESTRWRLRDRLEANDAQGSFGHPNSLAGLLTLVIPLLVARLMAVLWTRRWLAAMAPAILLMLLLTCLRWTHCRTALVALAAVAAAAGAIQIWHHGVARPSRWPIALTAGGLILLLVALASVGVFDDLVPRESLASLEFRLEWWQASLQVWWERPWLGVGWGNFASYYLRHKLPFSSEEIKDPHNWPLELACCVGVLGLAAYAVVVATTLRGLWRRTNGSTDVDELDRCWWLGCLLGVGVAGIVTGNLPWANLLLADGPAWYDTLTSPWLLTTVAGIVVVAWWPSLTDLGSAGSRTAFWAIVAVHIHWLGAGGVAYPSLMLPMVGLAATHRPGQNSTHAVGLPAWLLLVGTLLLLPNALMLFQSWQRQQMLVSSVHPEMPLSRMIENYTQAAEALFAEVATDQTGYGKKALSAADTTNQTGYGKKALFGDASAWARVMQVHRQAMLAAAAGRATTSLSAKEHYDMAWQAGERARALDLRAAWITRQLGELHRDAAADRIDPQALERAVAAFGTTCDLYPHSAIRRWEYATTLQQIGRREEAATQFAWSLWLDQTRHFDKKLSDDQRRLAQQLADTNWQPPASK